MTKSVMVRARSVATFADAGLRWHLVLSSRFASPPLPVCCSLSPQASAPGLWPRPEPRASCPLAPCPAQTASHPNLLEHLHSKCVRSKLRYASPPPWPRLLTPRGASATLSPPREPTRLQGVLSESAEASVRPAPRRSIDPHDDGRSSQRAHPDGHSLPPSPHGGAEDAAGVSRARRLQATGSMFFGPLFAAAPLAQRGGGALASCLEPIDPRSLMMRRWDAWIALLLVFVMIVSPFEVGFLRVDPDWTSPLFWINRVVDLGFFIDLLLNLNLMYYDAEAGRWISNRGKIARNYLLSGFFLVDLVSCFPFDLVSTVHERNRPESHVRPPAARRAPPPRHTDVGGRRSRGRSSKLTNPHPPPPRARRRRWTSSASCAS